MLNFLMNKNISYLIKECFSIDNLELPMKEYNYLLTQFDIISDLIFNEFYADFEINIVFKEYTDFEEDNITNPFTKLYLNNIIKERLQFLKEQAIYLLEYEIAGNIRDFQIKFNTIY